MGAGQICCCKMVSLVTVQTSMIMKLLRTTLLFLCLGCSPHAVAQLSDSGTLLDSIVAVVNDGVVLQSELEQHVTNVTAGLRAQGVALPPADILRSQVLETLVMKRIQLQRADRLGLTISDEEINRSLAMVAQRNGITLSDLPAALAREGLDYGRYREEMREEMALEQLRARDVGSRIVITRAEVDKIIAGSAPDNLEYEVLHMLIATPPDAGPDEVDQTEAKADELYQRLSDGAEFEPLAIAYSNSPEVLSNKGNLGYLKSNALPSIFSDQIVAMNPGDTAVPIKSPGGFHIVQLKDIRGVDKVMIDQRLARHILIIPNEVVSDEQARQEITDISARLRDGEDFATLAKSESDDTATANRGGDLGWSNRGTFVP
ncbi:MAG: peptidylprolyl isomerase, partial [Planctomycetota bacterium]|nr:peptidylprolyl isomerase [Planctomycetota bacterium]